MNYRACLTLIAVAYAVGVAPAAAQTVTKANVPGIRNFARVETTVACAGATNPEALAAIKEMGFVSVFNLRLLDEPGTDVAAETKAAQAAGLKFVSLPFSGGSPDPAVAGRFLETITTPGYQPAFIHCAGGARAAAMWLIKRLVVDGWDAARATAEAEALGLTAGQLRQFALDYARTRAR